ncbi:xaa-Pro aminopeptidase 1-like [Amphiura filiformis]|uniref:xaa-Pro aminopeptidase 1-like n=1 Tax=Amphiura filiformis TaxID=82378 RepID=UPI003B212E51
MLKHCRTCIFVVLTIGLVCGDPVAQPRVKRQNVKPYEPAKPKNGDLRDCTITPPYLPPTVIDTEARLAALRTDMTTTGIQAYIIPTEDAHQSEYVAEHDKRRQYICGFSGSAGLAIVTSDEALLWTDGRYFIQAERQLDCNWKLMKQRVEGFPTPAEWLAENLSDGDTVGFDPSLMAVDDYQTYEDEFDKTKDKNLTLASIRDNLIDSIWSEQPSYPNTVLLTLDAEIYTGETWQDKIWGLKEKSIRGKMMDEDVQALVVAKLDESAWIFNLRGQDVPYNPMFISYTIITTDSIRLYMYDRAVRLTEEVRSHLGKGIDNCENDESLSEFCVGIFEYDRFLDDLAALTEAKIWISTDASYAVYERVPEEKRVVLDSPILLMKAVKSEQEIKGMRNAHRKDSIALCELGAWLEKTVNALENPMEGDIEVLSELIVEEKAREFRGMQSDFQMNSFHDIAGFGANAAVIHYISSEDTNVAIHKNGTFLYDSGSQYLDGSTDITRTFHFGDPTDFMKEAYTRVLIGHISLALLTIRNDVQGGDVENIAREVLWRNGLDYRHGTGHGIGHFLTIHEPPTYFGHYPWSQPFEIGMFISDEPGYYEDGEFGIRIENIMEVVEAKRDHKFGDFTYMTFRMSSLVPMEPNLIDFSLFNPRELEWYNAYNERIRDEIGPDLSRDAKKWMDSKTRKISYTWKVYSAGSHVSLTTYTGLFVCLGLSRLAV